MRVIYSDHWIRKRAYRPDIHDEMIRYALQQSKQIKDKVRAGVLNAVCRIPPSGRMLKVAYRYAGKDTIKIITAFWMD
ncbi:MAG: hypothetical protein ACE5FT_04235 [Candidatus Nanoarchaeia archaeon]